MNAKKAEVLRFQKLYTMPEMGTFVAAKNRPEIGIAKSAILDVWYCILVPPKLLVSSSVGFLSQMPTQLETSE